MTTYETGKQIIDLTAMAFTGRVLDVGGGGEGVIARLSGSNVLAIDARADELEESPDVGWKIIMDACELKFIDNYFDHITFFYSLMYIGLQEHKQALTEAYRVLKPGGTLWLWDAIIPAEKAADVFIAHLEVKLPGEIIKTSYGAGWYKGQNMESVKETCEQLGFTFSCGNVDGEAFNLCLTK